MHAIITRDIEREAGLIYRRLGGVAVLAYQEDCSMYREWN